MRSRLWSTGARLWGAVGAVSVLVGLVWLTAWLLRQTGDDDGAGIANVLALPVSVFSLVAGLGALIVAWWSRPRVEDPAVLGQAARELLRAVTTNDAATLQQLLGDTGLARPADLRFIQPEAGVRWRDDGGAASGSLDDIAAYYQSLRLGRLMVLGAPGSGKTVLVLRLLLDLATAARADLDRDQVTRVLVPVRLSLSSFTIPDHPLTLSDLRERFETWVAEQVARHLTGSSGARATIARALVADEWVLPILDGLDEMDPDHTQPERARRVLAALNQPAGDVPCPLVLTCRSDEYQYLTHPPPAATSRRTPPAGVVQDATAIVVQPLVPGQVADWLTHRFPDPSQPNRIQARWRRVVSTIQRHPSGRLARCLSSPLRLYLACAVYTAPDTKPAQLCDLDPDTLDHHLLDHLVPAITRHHPQPDGTHYQPDDVNRWLTTLANHLNTMAHLGHSSTDIHFHRFWVTTDISSRRRIRHLATAVTVLPLTLLAATVWLVNAKITGQVLPDKSCMSILFFVAGNILYVANGANRASLHENPKRLDLSKLHAPSGRRRFVQELKDRFLLGLTTGLTLGLMNGLAGGLVIKPSLGLVLGITVGITGGIIFGLIFGLGSIRDTAARPSEPLHQNVASVSATALAAGIAGGITIGITGGLMLGITDRLMFGIMLGSMGGLMFGLTLGLSGLNTVPALPRYLLAVRALHGTNQLPRRTARFLDWAHTAGLFRLAGDATQFRHRDLQHHFTNPPLESAP